MNRIKAYAQLLRIPNVFTAWGDVVMGWMVGSVVLTNPRTAELRAEAQPLWELVLLMGASGSLYCAGMVLNDYCDLAEDQRERPHRPIPSGRISRATAGYLAVFLMVLGLGFAWLISTLPGRTGPAILCAGWLALVIYLYDAWLKRTWAGPLAMGACRFTNVLLGMSAAWVPEFMTETFPISCLFLAAVIGLYITGVTWFARTEATASNRITLWRARSVILVSIILAALWLAGWDMRWTWMEGAGWERSLSPLLLVPWCLIIAVPTTRAIHTPTPQRVQLAVKTCILGLIGLDAILAFAVVGWPGLLILLLLIPALVLGRWVYST